MLKVGETAEFTSGTSLERGASSFRLWNMQSDGFIDITPEDLTQLVSAIGIDLPLEIIDLTGDDQPLSSHPATHDYGRVIKSK